MIPEEIIENFNANLAQNELTIFCGESITAGLLASTIASISGASYILKGSIVTYDANVKTKILGVPQVILDEHTAESQETTNAMCNGLKRVFPGASIYVAVTGVASPSITDYKINKEVGQVYISILYQSEKIYEFDKILKKEDGSAYSRNEIREKTVELIFEKIQELIG